MQNSAATTLVLTAVAVIGFMEIQAPMSDAAPVVATPECRTRFEVPGNSTDAETESLTPIAVAAPVEVAAAPIPDDIFQRIRVEAQEFNRELLRRLA